MFACGVFSVSIVMSPGTVGIIGIELGVEASPLGFGGGDERYCSGVCWIWDIGMYSHSNLMFLSVVTLHLSGQYICDT